MPLTVNCMVCRNEFKIKPGRIKDGKGTYCSSKCAAELRKTGEYRKCETCDKQFYLNKTDLNDGRGKYCSDKCRYANTDKVCVCLNCGAGFYRNTTQLANGGGKYCSQHCSNGGRKKRIQKVCLGCNNTFSVIVSRANQANYCSMKCRYPNIQNFSYRPRSKTGFLNVCVTCKKSFYVMPSRKDKKY